MGCLNKKYNKEIIIVPDIDNKKSIKNNPLFLCSSFLKIGKNFMAILCTPNDDICAITEINDNTKRVSPNSS